MPPTSLHSSTAGAGSEQLEDVGLDAAQLVVVDLDAVDSSCFGQHLGLGLDDLGDQRYRLLSRGPARGAGT
jgi:hypothetical protein